MRSHIRGSKMSSLPEIERWLLMLGTGIAGLRLLKKYRFRSVEFDYFIESLDKEEIEISAFAPPPLQNQYAPLVERIQAELSSDIREAHTQLSDEIVDRMLQNTEKLHSLLKDIHQSVASGIFVV